MNTRMFKNGFQSAMILVVVAILGLAAGTLIRDLMQASSGDPRTKVVTKEQPEETVLVKKADGQAAGVTESQAAPEIPHFDILRVEKDGGVLVAGRTLPNNRIEVVRSTGEVLGKTTAKRNGDFVITLDEHLTRGEHILSLASTNQHGVKTVSVQSGVVFIPGASGEVLALINQDGKASRVATMPDSLKSNTGRAATDTASGENVSTEKLSFARKVTTIEKHPLLVEAVEVEGENVFVAGAVAPAALVRIYIDNVPVGSVRGTADHRFLLEKKFDLSQGEHVVRADVINEKTGGVWSRVVVDLKHEVPTELLNVAGGKGVELKATEVSNASTQVENTETAKTGTPKDDDTGANATVVQVDKVKLPVFTTTTVVETAKMENIQADSAEVAAATRVSDTKPAAFVVPKNVVLVMPKEEELVVAENALPVVPKNVVLVVPKNEEPAEPQNVLPVVPKNVVLVTPKNEEPVVPEKELPVVPKNVELVVPREIETPAAKTVEVTKIQTGSSIIIKWGDSLWRIARRTYGRGIRYTTIYNANRSQIKDPNKIYVGQVFKLPAKADL